MPWSATLTFRRALDEWRELVCAENIQWHPGTYSEVPIANKLDFLSRPQPPDRGLVANCDRHD
jgi:hypothetical protein